MPKKPKKKRHPVRNWAEYLLARAAIFLVGLMGLKFLYAFGRLASSLMFRFDKRHRRLAIIQISRSFPDYDDQKVLQIAKGAFDSAVLLGLEMFVAHKYINKENIHKYVDVKGLDNFRGYFDDAASGTITVTGHFGNWEIGGFTLAALGFKGLALARPLDNKLLHAYVKRVREVENMRIVDKKGGVKEAIRALAEGQHAGFIGDQDAGRKGIFVDFFGQPASTYHSVGLLAVKYNTPVIVFSVKRVGRQFHFEFAAVRIITPDQWADKPDKVRWVTQEYTTAIEEMIRKQPDQYFGWLHNRWKHLPDGSKRRYT